MIQKNIGIVTFPISKAGNIPLSNFVDVICSISDRTYVITGNEGYSLFVDDERVNTYGIHHPLSKSILSRIVNFVFTQFKISSAIFKLRKEIDCYILFIGGDGLILPMLTIKLLNKEVILAPVDYSISFKKDISSKVLKYLMGINRSLSDKIVIHSPILIDKWDLTKFSHKICIAHEYFLDFNKFSINKPFDQRGHLIGYVGRFTEEKGILNFIQSIPQILEKTDEVEFLICGDGPLFNEVEQYLSDNHLKKKVKLIGWVPHNKLPEYLNSLKLLVIPSYNESGPIIALEAIACGTPVVASKVGHILSLLVDNKDGFIMDDNSPECICKNVLRALEAQNIDEIIINAKTFVENGFNIDAAIDAYKIALSA